MPAIMRDLVNLSSGPEAVRLCVLARADSVVAFALGVLSPPRRLAARVGGPSARRAWAVCVGGVMNGCRPEPAGARPESARSCAGYWWSRHPLAGVALRALNCLSVANLRDVA